MTWKEKPARFLLAPTDGHVLGVFRIVFGLFMACEMLDYFQIELIEKTYFLPKVQLTYDFFEWLRPLPEPVMNMLLVLMLVCAVLIAIGLLFRPACLVFGSLYLYFFLLDKSLYNNHIYLFILLSFLLSFTHADEFLSLKAFFQKGAKRILKVPRWELFVLQLQFAIVYFYGGLAKLNYDWLVHMEPMQSMVDSFPKDHSLASILTLDFMVPFLTYGGLLFDLAIPFLLWKKSTRKWALIPLVLFHLPNSQIFGDIGIFPFVMLFSAVLFFDTAEIPLFNRLLTNTKKAKKNSKLKNRPIWVPQVLVVYFTFQLLFPFRGFFLPNDMDWTAIANRFSWRMKIQTREIEELTFYVQDGQDGQRQEVGINTFLNTMQLLKVAHDAKAVWQTAKMLERETKSMGFADPVVKANIKVRWNGRSSAPTVNPKIDLSKVEYSPFHKLKWVMPIPR